MKRGKFIVFEGGEGAGKSTQINTLASLLQDSNIGFLQTREPGGTEVGERIRDVLLDKTLPGMHSDTELLLMFAARAEHLQHKILPALDEGKWVICDRFTDASYAYQGYGRGIALERIEHLEQWVQQGIQPDLVIILDLEVEAGLKRVSLRGDTDRFEEEKVEFFEKVRTGYLKRAEQYPERYLVLDAAETQKQVATQLTDALQSKLLEWSN